MFLDTSKAFDNVCHEGLIYKLRQVSIFGEVLALINSSLNNRFQHVILNGKSSNWLPVQAGVPQGSILGPLLFLVYINDLSEKITSTVKLFADDTSLFSVVNGPNIPANELNNNLELISEYICKWKMSFNPDKNKQAQEVVFSQKQSKPKHPQLLFNKTTVASSSSQKHLGIILDEKLSLTNQIKVKIQKAGIGINVIKSLNNILPRQGLLTIYKTFIRPYLDYGDVIHDQPNNKSLCQTIESVQYKAALTITGAIKGTSLAKLYKELGLETLKFRQWCRRLCMLYKVKTYHCICQNTYQQEIILVIPN